MSTPFTAEFKVVAPPVAGQPDCPIPLTLASSYDHRAAYRLEFTGSGTKTLDLGTLGPNGAKLLVVSVDQDVSPAALPVSLLINGGDPIEVSQGGFLVLASPKPTAAGALTLGITHPTTAKLNVWVLG